MKNKNYIVKGTPIVPSLCGIGMALLWYIIFYFGEGQWAMATNSFSFEELTGIQTYLTVMNLATPIVFFICVLFLAEMDLKWMLPALLVPIVLQTSLFSVNFAANVPDYIFQNPCKFAAPFLALILFVLTTEKILPNKWIFVAFCGVAILLPLLFTVFGKGEFTDQTYGYDAMGNVVPLTYYFWSDFAAYALTYVGLGALAVQMRAPRESDFVSLKEMKKAYDEKIAAQEAQAFDIAEETPENTTEEPSEEPEETL